MNENKVGQALALDIDPLKTSHAMQSRSLWIEHAGMCQIRREPLREPDPNEILIRALYSGISRGTESLVFNGLVPESEFERMRGPHMEGRFSFPVKYGYASVGRVEVGPAGLAGKNVFCLHPHQDIFITSPEMVSVLPDGVPPERAVLAANMETALNIVWDAGIQPGDRVAVFGAGVVGSLVASLSSRIVGTETVVIDTNPGRQRHIGAMGIGFAQADKIENEFDVLINASASAEALTSAISHAALEARIVEASWYGDRVSTIPLGGAFHSKRLSILSSQVGAIPASRSRRWNFNRRMSKALELLLDDRLDNLISGKSAFSDLAADYPHILSSQDTLCHCIRY